MAASRFICRRLWLPALGFCWLAIVGKVNAQEQERKLIDRIQRPDMDLTAKGFEKTYTPTSKGIDKSASVKSFAFNHAAMTRSGENVFRTHNFANGRQGYHAENYTTKSWALAARGNVSTDRTYDTKAMAVSEDRAAGKSADTQPYQSSSKLFTPQGKRQDEMDDLRRRKNLTVDEVRELLNKNK